ncbi:unnamed protein product [Pleuronectes platessa]|uniref:Uncharacterized protein n=1 Tax=Pleuronectes platessa TaxID=8262 RepID=A0A9N7U2G2_PLEPL|nr:unnamed protein product [Pleuronectes platessa]
MFHVLLIGSMFPTRSSTPPFPVKNEKRVPVTKCETCSECVAEDDGRVKYESSCDVINRHLVIDHIKEKHLDVLVRPRIRTHSFSLLFLLSPPPPLLVSSSYSSPVIYCSAFLKDFLLQCLIRRVVALFQKHFDVMKLIQIS